MVLSHFFGCGWRLENISVLFVRYFDKGHWKIFLFYFENISLLFVRYFDKATNKGRWGPQGIEQQKIWKGNLFSYIPFFYKIQNLLLVFFFSLDDKNYSFYTIPLDGFFGRWRARPDFIFFKWILLVNFNFPQVCVGSCQLHSHSFIKTSNFTFHNLEETQAWHHLNYNPKRNPKS